MVFISLLVFLFSLKVYAVEVAFITALDATKEDVVLEENGRFFHVAISYQGAWFHAHPVKGVELTKSFEDIGKLEVILSNPDIEEPSYHKVESHLGKPFQLLSTWYGQSSFYCSKLIGRVLNIEPKPMWFEGGFWSGIPNLPRGDKGLSPDDIYEELIKMNFRPKQALCSSALSSRHGRASSEVLDAKAGRY